MESRNWLARLGAGRANPVANAGGFNERIRLVVSPTAGTFVLRDHPASLAGVAVRGGDCVGHVTTPGGDVAVRSQFDGEVVELLAHPGERVRQYQPICWLTADDLHPDLAGRRLEDLSVEVPGH